MSIILAAVFGINLLAIPLILAGWYFTSWGIK
jgi:hypothetical protein